MRVIRPEAINDAVLIASNTSWRESVVATVIFFPFTLNVPAVTAVAIGSVARVVPETSLVAERPLPMSEEPWRREAVASWVTLNW